MKKNILSDIKKIMGKHKGKQNAISAGKIGEMLNLKQEDTHVEPRMYIYEMMEKYKIPIAAGSKGYYVVNNREELNEYMRSLNNRISGIKKRKQVVQAAFKEFYRK